ncbi:hypothetical protein FGD67_12375 [Colwellia sp. M166]|uniref:hypothetical protein n=1 Tax=Colwellia sp. M166 TaxID=2583805 RepID=UPI00211EFD9E|nr:hypothetical protein [Colwellia sp. M166]UUO23930.1 hypothetical protein FGD67_12375 [Colwellia sp. M166]|tara:strand:- start:993 stop:1565 length:573 start_codon:yes stop_codon:yes gene_type:complete
MKVNSNQTSMILTVPAALLCACMGTGGAFASESTERLSNPKYTFTTAVKSEIDDETLFSGGGEREFQKQSKQLQESFGLNVTQYSTLMQTTRSSVYKWHDLNTPLKKVRSKTQDRFNQLSFALYLIKERHQTLFGEWLRNPLDPLVQEVNELLEGDTILRDDFIELSTKINISLRKVADTKDLNNMLGIA